jgi:hypothetical protein
VNSSLSAEYDGNRCYALYRQFLTGGSAPSDEDEMAILLGRYIRICLAKRYIRLDPEVRDDLVQATLLELWRLFRAGKVFPTENPAVWHGFLNTIIRRRSARTYRELYDDAPREIDPILYVREQYSHKDSAHRLEAGVFMSELPGTLKARIKESNRLRFPLLGDAIAYIADSILARKRVVFSYLRREFRVADPLFLIDHVKVRLRMELHEIKETVDLGVPDDQRAVLFHGIEGCLAAQA